MTALSEYQRLECTGLWRDQGDGQRREVIVAFGDATLVISDARNARALAHWSLPAITRRNPGERPALFGPGAEDGEELELDDDAMIAAIAKVHSLIAARRPHPGRLRGLLLGGLLAAVLGSGALWLPGALIEHTAAALPFAKRQEIGLAALADLAKLTGGPCLAAEGAAALAVLDDRLVEPGGQVYVLPNRLKRSAVLPGRLILVSRALAEDEQSPEVLAGEILAASLRLAARDPMVALLRYAGLSATFSLLTSGDLPADALDGYGEVLIDAPPAPVKDADLLARFAAVGLSSRPYAYSLDPSGETVLPLIEADPVARGAPAQPVLDDAGWVALQGICGE